MSEPNGWGLRRYATIVAVLGLHAAFLALMLMASHTRTSVAAAAQPIELLFLPPAKTPAIRLQSSRPQRLSGVTLPSIGPPVLDSSATSVPAPGPDGSGSSVDWKAEARRAVQAFEIRKHQPPANRSVSGSPGDDILWPRVQHHAGDQYKTANGDWIVWINSSCYQAAGATSSVSALEPLRRTICPDDPNAPEHGPANAPGSAPATAPAASAPAASAPANETVEQHRSDSKSPR
jgi:hypothetical protein